MRLWSLHPKYLDPRGLVALWREALLAQKVLLGKTKGYRSHPQLARFQSHPEPTAAIASYLRAVHDESIRRGYVFDAGKIEHTGTAKPIVCTRGQLLYEWKLLMKKLKSRDPARYRDLLHHVSIEAHPLFDVVDGEREPWEAAHRSSINYRGK
ncbi:MAG: pyrimidine dimer DNA glycosylase/endonuclease V [Betaproteobacteria bacterium]